MTLDFRKSSYDLKIRKGSWRKEDAARSLKTRNILYLYSGFTAVLPTTKICTFYCALTRG